MRDPLWTALRDVFHDADQGVCFHEPASGYKDCERLADDAIELGYDQGRLVAVREPGTYRTPDGGIEVIVGIAESASWVEDTFPDEVAYLRGHDAQA